MRLAKLIALVGVIAMGGVLLYAFTSGDFAEEGRQLLALPWGVVSLVDLYVGFSLFSLWIVYRENSPGRSLVWIVLVMVLGFFAASLYTFLALQASGGNWERFWQGRHA
jgi:type IV secretory pathway VirB2 component (pilin)